VARIVDAPPAEDHSIDLAPRPRQRELARGGIDTVTAILPGLALRDLLDLRTRIEALLPARSLQDLNLERELVLQVMALQAMQGEVISDPDIPANQRAQVANSLSAALANLVKVQESTYSAERFKRIERLLIETLRELPEDAASAFLDKYEKALAGL